MTRQEQNKTVLLILIPILILATALGLLSAVGTSPNPDETPLAPRPAASSSRLGEEEEETPGTLSDHREAVLPGAFDPYGAAVGTHLQFRLRMELSMSLENLDPKAPPEKREQEPVHISCQGGLFVTISDRKEGEILVTYALPGLRLDVTGKTGGRTAEWADSVAQGLRQGFDVRYGARGDLRGYRFPKQLTADQRNWARSIVNALVFEVDPGSRRWQCTAEDCVGKYDLALRRLADNTVERRKKTLRPHGQSQGDYRDIELCGQAIAIFAPEVGWIRSVKLDDRMSWTLTRLSLQIDYQLRGSLELLQVDRQAPGDVDWSGPWAKVSGHEERSQVMAEEEERQWRKRLEGKSLRQLIDALGEMLRNGNDRSPEFFETMRLIAKMVELRPGIAEEIARQIQTYGVRDQLAAALLGTLGMAGTDAAQIALDRVFQNTTLGTDVRGAAVDSMFQLRKPRQQLVQSLRASLNDRGQLGSLDDVGNTTMLLLGAYAQKGVRPADGSSLLDDLLAREELARRSGSLRAWFEALGNSGDPRVLEVARRYLASADENLRALALTAIRRVPTEEAFALLRHHARNDAAATVRAHGLGLIGAISSPASQAVLRSAFEEEKDSDVRRAALIGLISRARDDAMVRAWLRRRLESERDEALKALLRQVMS